MTARSRAGDDSSPAPVLAPALAPAPWSTTVNDSSPAPALAPAPWSTTVKHTCSDSSAS